MREAIRTQRIKQIRPPSGFGKRVSWDEQDFVPPGHTIVRVAFLDEARLGLTENLQSFKNALLFSVQRMGPRVALPDWLLSMTKWGRETIAGLDDYRVSDHLNENDIRLLCV